MTREKKTYSREFKIKAVELSNQRVINSVSILSDKIGWMKVEWLYIASGGEKYITIGNFNTASTSDTLNVGASNPGFSYYYIDDVYVGSCDTAKTSAFLISNIFTPNNDNTNDFFKITAPNLKTLNCKIYDRWGILVGELKDINDVWDGRTTAGLECTDGVYYYILSAKGTDEKEYDKKGFIQIVR